MLHEPVRRIRLHGVLALAAVVLLSLAVAPPASAQLTRPAGAAQPQPIPPLT